MSKKLLNKIMSCNHDHSTCYQATAVILCFKLNTTARQIRAARPKRWVSSLQSLQVASPRLGLQRSSSALNMHIIFTANVSTILLAQAEVYSRRKVEQ